MTLNKRSRGVTEPAGRHELCVMMGLTTRGQDDRQFSSLASFVSLDILSEPPPPTHSPYPPCPYIPASLCCGNLIANINLYLIYLTWFVEKCTRERDRITPESNHCPTHEPQLTVVTIWQDILARQWSKQALIVTG